MNYIMFIRVLVCNLDSVKFFYLFIKYYKEWALVKEHFIWCDEIFKLQARIKKIMQADEDVGKIALAVPVLVCELLWLTLLLTSGCWLFVCLIHVVDIALECITAKALELFLQDLCDRTYEITLQRGAKTMNSLHL